MLNETLVVGIDGIHPDLKATFFANSPTTRMGENYGINDLIT